MYDWLKNVETKTINPRDMKFSVLEWLWALFAYARFWNKKFHAPYVGLTYRKAMILMRLRGERPMTMEEAVAYLNNQPREAYRLFGGSVRDEPIVTVGHFDTEGLSVTHQVPYLTFVDREPRLTWNLDGDKSNSNIHWPTRKD